MDDRQLLNAYFLKYFGLYIVLMNFQSYHFDARYNLKLRGTSEREIWRNSLKCKLGTPAQHGAKTKTSRNQDEVSRW